MSTDGIEFRQRSRDLSFLEGCRPSVAAPLVLMRPADPRPELDDDPPPLEAERTVSDREAAEWLFFRHYRRVLYFFHHAKRFSRDEAQDLTQETFARVYKNVGRLRIPLDKAAPWVQMVADSVYKNEIRRRRTDMRRGQETSLDALPASMAPQVELTVVERAEQPADPLEQVLERERAVRLHEAVGRLPPKMRRALRLFLRGFKYREIAILMNVSIETVKSQIHQAKARVREVLGEERELF